ncbi:gp2 hypothetical protein [Klebsiella phage 05F01]|nr:gp2 hypothetical protein [Klebsiella phage 05F01]
MLNPLLQRNKSKSKNFIENYFNFSLYFFFAYVMMFV